MKRISFIHWNAAESKALAQRIQRAGYRVSSEVPDGMEILKRLRREPPDAVVISLERLPSHGRDIGVAIRQSKATRHVPVVFAGGEPEKVKRVQQTLPDAVYASWPSIESALKLAITNAPREPVVPTSVLAGYANTPLPKKLGIKPDTILALVNAPPDFAEVLGELPSGVQFRDGATGNADLMLWFTRSREEIETQVDWMATLARKGPLWIVWPKKSSEMACDLSQQIVRAAALAAGLVDYKVCSIDSTWSGLLFSRQK